MELSTADQGLASERAARERDLAERRAHVRMIEEAQAEQERRDREAAEAAAARAALEAETNPQRRTDANNNAANATADGERWREEEERRLSAYEEAFRRIKEATGVSDVSEVISKFLTAEDTATHLKTLTKEAQARIDGLMAARDDAKRAVEEARYAGSVAAAERKAVDELETQLVDARAQQERLKQRFDRMSKILLAIRAGVSHLCGKLDALRLRTADGRRTSTANIGTVPGADEDLVLQLFRQVEAKLTLAVEALREVEGADKTALSDPAVLASMTFLSLEDVELKPGNLRVGARAYASDEDEDAEDMDSAQPRPGCPRAPRACEPEGPVGRACCCAGGLTHSRRVRCAPLPAQWTGATMCWTATRSSPRRTRCSTRTAAGASSRRGATPGARPGERRSEAPGCSPQARGSTFFHLRCIAFLRCCTLAVLLPRCCCHPSSSIDATSSTRSRRTLCGGQREKEAEEEGRHLPSYAAESKLRRRPRVAATDGRAQPESGRTQHQNARTQRSGDHRRAHTPRGPPYVTAAAIS